MNSSSLFKLRHVRLLLCFAATLICCVPEVAFGIGACDQWSLATPPARSYPAMAYDSNRNTIVMFGGSSPGFPNGAAPDTWEWNGTSWKLLAMEGPSPSSSSKMVYDSGRGVIVLFGGHETWEWNGTAWVLRATTGPSERFAFGMAYDSGRGVTVLFGGTTGGNETWEWNGSVWALRATTGPSARSEHAMAYNSGHGVTLLFGGSAGGNETWEWNGTAWSLRASTGPSARIGHSMAFDPSRNEILLYGGVTTQGTLVGDLWRWNGVNWTQLSTSNGPSVRQGAPLVYNSAQGKFILFGGSGAPPNYHMSDLWEWNGTSWTMRVGVSPAVSRHALIKDSARDRVVLFGGETKSVSNGAPITLLRGETWEWNGSIWNDPGNTGPSPRTSPAMAYDTNRGTTVLFGGYSGVANGDTWESDGGSWILRSTSGPSARYGHRMSYDSIRHVVVLFGGSAGGNETWEWNGTTWALRATTGPSARSYHSMSFDSVRGFTVLFGGSAGGNETWEWNGTTWALRATTGPSARVEHAMAYWPSRGVTILQGGLSQGQSNDETWEWNGTTWLQKLNKSSVATWSHSMIYDDTNDRLVLVGGLGTGSNGQPNGMTWKLSGNTTDTDSDGTPDCAESCPNDPAKINPGVCGCGIADTDTDGDGTPNCNDQCSTDSAKVAPGLCGCGFSDADSDSDGTPNCSDACPSDPLKVVAGLCGCGVADTDTDGDGTPNCNDRCTTDPNKTTAGICGCGVSDIDSDSDGTPNCHDSCPSDPFKLLAGQCGCGIADIDSNHDGIANCIDSSNDSDSDGDGVKDAQELIDGTNPNDRGSVLSVLSTTLCSEWNGFLGGMWNIMEHVNMSTAPVTVQTTLYSISGDPQGSRGFSIPAGAQFDLLVHDIPGWTKDSYGKVCSTVTGGNAGDLDGRMVYYKALDPAGMSYDFAFAMPFLNGSTGKQFVPFNTFQPSLDPKDKSNLVANWIQLTNLEGSAEEGTLRFYGQDGSELGVPVRVSLAGGARQDFSGHQFGPNLVGIIGWTPDTSSAKFQLRNVRYFYDNAFGQNSFDTAFQLEGLVGTGEVISVPLDTNKASAIIEVANVANSSQAISVDIYQSNGTAVSNIPLNLPPNGSIHLITDDLLKGGEGVALIKGSLAEGVIAVAMQYGRTSTAGVKYVYGTPARQAVGAVLRSSYNTFLNQGCRLFVVNPTATDKNATIRMTRFDATQVLSDEPIVVPKHGLIDYDLCGNEAPKNYGVVTVETGTPNSLLSSVVRLGINDDYRFPTPVRQ